MSALEPSRRRILGLEKSNKEPENVKTIETPAARYRLLYEQHGVPHIPEELGDAQALALEGLDIVDFSFKGGAENAMDRYWDFHLQRARKEGPQVLEKLLRWKSNLQKNKIPLYLIDRIETDDTYDLFSNAGTAIKGGEMVLGVLSSPYVLSKLVVPSELLSRREALKFLMTGIVAIKGDTHVVEYLARERRDHFVPENTQLSGIEKNIIRFSETVNPESEAWGATFRNALWAYKLSKIAKKIAEPEGSKPSIAIQLGRAHSGLEDMLLFKEEELLAYIEKVMKILSIVVDVGEKNVRISPIARLEYVGGFQGWGPTETYEDSELRRIEKAVTNAPKKKK